MPETDLAGWREFIDRRRDAHLLQTAEWGELKAAFGWKPLRWITQNRQDGEIGAQALLRKLPLGYTLAYIPKGPLCDTPACNLEPLWDELDDRLRSERAVLLKVEPDAWETPDDAAPPGFVAGAHSIQPRRTLLIDLSGDEDALLGRMKQKTRYNIRLAQKKSVTVQPCGDIDGFHALMTVTGGRDGFGVHSRDYYRRVYELFHPRGECELLFATYEGEPLAALMVFGRGKRAWYFYGASSDAHRERMPAYLLQWEAMRWARRAGCTVYDLWGVPDEDEAVLEAGFTARSDGLWGVYRFKRGFGGALRRAAAPCDRVYNSLVYRFYTHWAARSSF